MWWPVVLVALQFLALARQGVSTSGETLDEVSQTTADSSSVNRRSALVRMETHHHHHHAHHMKAIFQGLDKDGNGRVSADEIEAMEESTHHQSKAVTELANAIQRAGSTGLSWEEFARLDAPHTMKEMDRQQKAASLGEQHEEVHGADIHEHKNVLDDWIKSVRSKDSNLVTCGGHKAPSCAQCTITDSGGNNVFDHGSEWCNGDCVWHDLKCHLKGTVTVTVSGTSTGTANGYGTTPIPDIMNPNITSKDKDIIDKAAGAAIREENMEAAEKQRAEEEEMQAKKFSWGKFWLISIITISVICGICAIVTVVGVCVYYNMGSPTKESEEDEAEDEGLADAAAEVGAVAS